MDQLVGGWLDALARAENGLLKVCGRQHLREAAREYLSSPEPRPSLDGSVSSAPRADREEAASLLRAAVASGSYPQEVCSAAADLSHALEKARPRAASRAADILSQALAAIESARTREAVAQVMAEAAVRLCRAKSAAWWERTNGSLHAVAFAGLEIPEATRAFRPPKGFWTTKAIRGGRFVELLPDRPEHAAFLSLVGAHGGAMVRARIGGRWQGALSVHDCEPNAERRGLVFALVDQGAAAMQALSSETFPELVSEPGPAMDSAADLDDLLHRICDLIAEEAEGACFLFLTDEADRLRLRASAGARADEAPQAEAALGTTAAQICEWDSPREAGIDSLPPGDGSLSDLHASGFRRALGLPLMVHDRCLGALLVLSRHPASDDEAEVERIQTVAWRAAAEIENMQLLESAQRRLTEISDLTRMGRRVVNTVDLDAIAQTVVQSVAEVLDVPRAAIFIATGEGNFAPLARGQYGFAQAKTKSLPATGHIGAEAVVAQTALTVADAPAEGRETDPLVLWMGARSLACAPLMTPQELRGILAVADDVPRGFELHALSLLSTHANQAALALQGALLYQQALERLRRLTKLGEVAKELAASQSPRQSAGILLESARTLFDAAVGMVWLVSPDTNELSLLSSHGFEPDEWMAAGVRLNEGLPELVAQSGQPLISADITRDGRFPYRQQARGMGLGPALAAPLISRGRVVGVISLYRQGTKKFTEDDRALLLSMASNAAIALENAHLLEEAQRRAEFVAAMMSEVNHRMRNSLQSVAGLLRMELERSPMRSVEDTVRRAISHIQAVAAVHEVVREPEVYLVDIKEVALRVAKLPRMARDRPVEVQVGGTRVMLPSQRAISVALVLNELVDNAIRHGPTGGRVSVSLAEGGGDVIIQVRSTGPVAPKDADFEAGPGLGLKIVRGLVEQELGGKLELEAKNGFVVRARFPKVV